MNRWWIAVGLAVCAAAALHAQTARPAFEVASVKRNPAPFAPATLAERPGGNVIAIFQPLDRLAHTPIVSMISEWSAPAGFAMAASISTPKPVVMCRATSFG